MVEPKYHVFVVDSNTYPVHTGKGFCGVKNPKGGGRVGLISDVKTYRKGDFVIFYQMRVGESPLNRGFRDVFKIISDPFYDDSVVEFNGNKVLGKCPICGYPYSEEIKKDGGTYVQRCSNPENHHELPREQHILPYRVLIEPVMRFDKPVDDNTAYVDAEDYGELPTLRWRKVTGAGRARSAQRILPEEAEKLIRLMKKLNEELQSENTETSNYISPSQTLNKLVPKTLEIKRDTSGVNLFSVKRDGSFSGEYGLETWMLENIDKGIPVLKDIVGSLDELEFFGNNVQYGVGGENADILLLHKKAGKRFKATVVELKKDSVNLDTIDQVLNPEKQNYAKWIGQLVTANCNPEINRLEIQPVMVGSNVTNDAIQRVKDIERNFKTFSSEIEINYQYRNRTNVKIKVLKPILLSYKVQDNKVNFTKTDYSL
jgi:uncharacterized Zn finger protein (UPF0148 family)